ncbi:hypothetical protein LTR05_005085 [Lithohypha guttulata]|uniref:Nucleolar pre-ribosomal-associated protein 1 n=1 Tax=Lithohypha guttulata TaxID=1690604 RepID=A0AAN7SZQ5_9EURO|nr:hypothetical protein LTR05_005085 [Lithohypha guttulata]
MADIHERPAKRLKTSSENHITTGPVNTVDQIHEWINFQQSTDPVVKDGLNAFKDYLFFISNLEDAFQQAEQFRILKEYCLSQQSISDDQLNFHDLLSTWSFAVENNAEAIILAVPSALAQLLKAIGGIIELRSFGLALIDSLLKRDQSKLFEKCLASPRTKPHLASPCLRLLTEMINFDAGARATEFWYRRDLIMYKFEAVLELQVSSNDVEERKRPSVRRMALRLIIAMLKYLDSTSKLDLLAQARAIHACLRGLTQDGDDIVNDVLQAIDQHLISDNQLSRVGIARFFNAVHLENLSALYSYELEDETGDARDSVRTATHKLLVKLCASGNGVLVPQQGWYPPSLAAPSFTGSGDDFIDLGLDSPFYFDDRSDRVPVVNTTLATFIHKLKPYGDNLQSSLLLSILGAAPELVAEYFGKHKQISAASSDDVIWRGQFALIFAAIEAPIPKDLGQLEGQPHSPPPLKIVIESVLPRPIDRAYLTKMLSSKDEVLQISAARLVAVALTKLHNVLDAFARYSSTNTFLWHQASDKLCELAESRLPTLRDLNLSLQHSSSVDDKVRPALLECLLAYHNVLSNKSTSTTFDIAPIMTEMCLKLENSEAEEDLILEQLANCVQIAESSPTTKWLHKPDNGTLSPLSRLFRVCVTAKSSFSTRTILGIIRQVLIYRGVLSSSETSFAALCSSFLASKKFSATTELFVLFDNCIVRASARPVKYLDETESASQAVSDKKPLSLFVAAIAEQWYIVLKRYEHDKSVVKNIAAWIARLFSLLDSAGENYRVMMHFQEAMLRGSDGKARSYLQDALDKVRKKALVIETTWYTKQENRSEAEEALKGVDNKLSNADHVLERLCTHSTSVPDSLQGLDKWPAGFDVELEMSTQRLQRLILCLSANDAEVKLQANQVLKQILQSIDSGSSNEGKQQIFLILGELCETVNQYDLAQPLPTFVPVLANALLTIALQPQHIMFPKANKFLLRKPSWSFKGTVDYWLEHILREAPHSDDEDGWNKEREWLLQIMSSGLRSQIDMELYRRCNLWEHVLSLYSSPCLSQQNKLLILALLRNGIDITGGADMLWTRFGVYGWLSIMSKNDFEHADYFDLLKGKLEKRCDTEAIERWKATCRITRAGTGDID